MGARAKLETLLGVVSAFGKKRTWTERALATELGMPQRAVRLVLAELQGEGWPFEEPGRGEANPWTLPPSWFPKGVTLEGDSLAVLFRLLRKLPDNEERRWLLRQVLGAMPEYVARAIERVIAPGTTEQEEAYLSALMESAAERQALRLRYFVASESAIAERVVSVVHVLQTPPSRFLARCGSAKDLKWFRVDAVVSLERSAEAYEEARADLVEATLLGSVEGLYATHATRVRFVIRSPDARWAARSLPLGISGYETEEGFVVDTLTHSVLPVARFVVGLGESARCESAELRTLVRALAQGALERQSLQDSRGAS